MKIEVAVGPVGIVYPDGVVIGLHEVAEAVRLVLLAIPFLGVDGVDYSTLRVRVERREGGNFLVISP